MTPEDEKRLAEIRELQHGSAHSIIQFLLIRLDESDRARTKAERKLAECGEATVALHVTSRNSLDRADRAEAALVDERAKREAAEEHVRILEENDTDWQTASTWLERAEAAEARVAELETIIAYASRAAGTDWAELVRDGVPMADWRKSTGAY